jgi:transcriptional antiterminator RfaH
MSGLDWYVVHSHPRKESFVCERIGDLGREVFFPTVSERRAGRSRASIGPLFPGYLFARLSEPEGDLPRVRWTHGVRNVLGNGDGPRPVDDELVEMIRGRADRRGRVRLGAGLRTGDRVRVVDGPLTGLVGVLERSASGPMERVCVLLEVFHRLTRVELPLDAIRGAARS